MKPIRHGTTAGYRTHYRRDEKPCDDCQDAYTAERPSRTAAARANKAARRKADRPKPTPQAVDDAPPQLADTLRFLADNAAIAACREVDPELFHPKTGRRDMEDAALRVCYGCPLVRPCLLAALANKSPGVWGATTARDRRRLLREKRAA